MLTDRAPRLGISLISFWNAQQHAVRGVGRSSASFCSAAQSQESQASHKTATAAPSKTATATREAHHDSRFPRYLRKELLSSRLRGSDERIMADEESRTT